MRAGSVRPEVAHATLLKRHTLVLTGACEHPCGSRAPLARRSPPDRRHHPPQASMIGRRAFRSTPSPPKRGAVRPLGRAVALAPHLRSRRLRLGRPCSRHGGRDLSDWSGAGHVVVASCEAALRHARADGIEPRGRHADRRQVAMADSQFACNSVARAAISPAQGRSLILQRGSERPPSAESVGIECHARKSRRE